MENNLNLYYIFYSVAKCKNISGAAKELYISQPAISKAISKLEQNLNTTLFVRNSRGVTLTAEGEMLFEQIQTAFACIRTGEEKIKLSTELGIGHLSIGVSTTLCKYVLLPYLKEFTRKYPHIRIKISCQSSTETIEALQNHSIDIGLIGYPENKLSLTYHPIMEIHDVFVTTKNYLDNFKKRESLSREGILKSATFMMLNKENITRKYIDSYLLQNQTEISNIIEVSNMDLLIEFAKIDLGIACVIREFVLNELENHSLKELSLLPSSPAREIGFAYSKQNYRENPSLVRFLEEC
ncbi:MAG: LysR family transcriptional regulator [Lachnospiraceae bacterium]